MKTYEETVYWYSCPQGCNEIGNPRIWFKRQQEHKLCVKCQAVMEEHSKVEKFVNHDDVPKEDFVFSVDIRRNSITELIRNGDFDSEIGRMIYDGRFDVEVNERTMDIKINDVIGDK